jgi:nucleotide-binding universal stress UspA family protein
MDNMLYITSEMMMSESVVQTESDATNQYLTQVTTPYRHEGLSTEQVVMFGTPDALLLSTIETCSADLVVMCSHGRTGFTRWAMGSIAEKVARYSSVPVLVLREHGPIPANPHLDPTHPLRVLVPLDGSTHAKTAITPAANLIAALAAPQHGALHLMRVIQPAEGNHAKHEQHNIHYIVQKIKHSLHKTVENVRDGFEAPAVAPLGLQITSSVALDSDVAQAIIRVAENGEDAEGAGIFGGCDVIAMATHGRTGLNHLTMGSITERVLHATQLPLLIVHTSPKTDQKASDKVQHTDREHSTPL